MVRLRDGIEITVWPRWLILTGPGRAVASLDPQWLEGLTRLVLGAADATDTALAQVAGDIVEAGSGGPREDPWLWERLRQLDGLYGGWLLAAEHDATLAEVERLHARRRIYDGLARAWPTLPVSTVMRRNLVAALDPGRVLVLDDADGLGVLLARAAEVVAVAPGAAQRAWLSTEANVAGCGDRLRVVAAVPESGVFDVVVGAVGAPAQLGDLLARAAVLLPPAGWLLLSLRHPWDGYAYDRLAAAGFTVSRYLRDVDHAYVPGGFVVDGGADLVLLRRAGEPPPPAPPPDDAESVRAQPYALVEVESLAPERIDANAIDRMVTAVELMAPSPQALRDSLRETERDLVWWYDLDGNGFSAELRRDKAHVAVVLAPYHPGLAAAVCCAAMWTLGDERSRTFPLRTTRSPESVVLA